MFILFPSGGLGNQMFMIASVYSFAKSLGHSYCVNYGKHTLIQGQQLVSYCDNIFHRVCLHTPERQALVDYKIAQLGYSTHLFVDEYKHTYFKIPQQHEQKIFICMDSNFLSLNYFDCYRQDLLELFSLPQEQEVELNLLCQQYLRNYSNANYQRRKQVAREELAHNKSSLPSATITLEQRLFRLQNSNHQQDIVAPSELTDGVGITDLSIINVSVHVRRGDYLNLADTYQVLDLDYYQQAVTVFKGKGLVVNLVVFSDDVTWCQQEFAQLDLEDFSRNKSSFSLSYVDANIPDYLALLLMARCDHHIIANSTFSWWGQYLNCDSHRLVIAPKEYFISSEQNQNVATIFPDWMLKI